MKANSISILNLGTMLKKIIKNCNRSLEFVMSKQAVAALC